MILYQDQNIETNIRKFLGDNKDLFFFACLFLKMCTIHKKSDTHLFYIPVTSQISFKNVSF